MRFAIPSLPSPRRRTSRPESVTAERILRVTTSAGSVRSRVPWGVPPVVDIFRVGSWRSITRPPVPGIAASGSFRSSP